MKNTTDKQSKINWSKLAGLASQWAVAMVVLIFLGKYLDQLHFIAISMPLFIWLLPFAFIVFSLFNIVKQTDTKSTKEPD